ncbi:Embryogenesis-associated protein EMB8, partial [Camellia lanceoleosa]
MPDDRHPHPSLEVVGGGGRDSFLRALKILNRPYEYCYWTKDNGSVALDWVSGDDFRLPPDSPLLILLVIYASKGTQGIDNLCRYLGDFLLLSLTKHHCIICKLQMSDNNLSKAYNSAFDQHSLLFEDMRGEYNIKLAANAKSVKEFDEGLSRVPFGFKSADDYYSNSSNSDSIKHVCTPLLCIQAANDPISPSRGIPRKDIQ